MIRPAVRTRINDAGLTRRKAPEKIPEVSQASNREFYARIQMRYITKPVCALAEAAGRNRLRNGATHDLYHAACGACDALAALAKKGAGSAKSDVIGACAMMRAIAVLALQCDADNWLMVEPSVEEIASTIRWLAADTEKRWGRFGNEAGVLSDP